MKLEDLSDSVESVNPAREAEGRKRGRPSSRDDAVEQVGRSAFKAGGLVWEKRSYTPNNGTKLSMHVDSKDLNPSLHYCWVNEDRINEFEQMDYKIVPNYPKRYVGRFGQSELKVGYAHLMCIPKPWFEEQESDRHRQAEKKGNKDIRAAALAVDKPFLPDGYKPITLGEEE